MRKGGRVVTSRLSPRSTGFERELYPLAGVDGLKRQAIETEFFSKQIDNHAAPVLMELVDQRVGYLSDADRVIFSHFLMSLRAGHPGAVEKARRDGACPWWSRSFLRALRDTAFMGLHCPGTWRRKLLANVRCTESTQFPTDKEIANSL
jgi:hypothetical protein